MKLFKRILIGLVIILGIAGGAGYYYLQQSTYEPSTQATQASQHGKDEGDYLLFGQKNNKKEPLVIFYPGALVEPESYSIWANDLAENGYTVAIAKMPLDLAILSGNRADKIREDFPDRNYVIGGHSLGGVMASRYANANSKEQQLKGIFYLASYPDKKGTLAKSKLPILSITASNDQVLDQEAYESAKDRICFDRRWKSWGLWELWRTKGRRKSGDHERRSTNGNRQHSTELVSWTMICSVAV